MDEDGFWRLLAAVFVVLVVMTILGAIQSPSIFTPTLAAWGQTWGTLTAVAAAIRAARLPARQQREAEQISRRSFVQSMAEAVDARNEMLGEIQSHFARDRFDEMHLAALLLRQSPWLIVNDELVKQPIWVWGATTKSGDGSSIPQCSCRA